MSDAPPSLCLVPWLIRLVLIHPVVFCAGVAASCSFWAFVALRLCGGRALELAAGPRGAATAPLSAMDMGAKVRPKTVAITHLAKVDSANASTPQHQSVHHNKIGRALALLLPVCAVVLFDRQVDPTDTALNHGLRAVSVLTGPHYGESGVMLPKHTTAQLRSLYAQLLPTPTAISRPSGEWFEVPRSAAKEQVRTAKNPGEEEDVGSVSFHYPTKIRLLTPNVESSASRRLFQVVDGNGDGIQQTFRVAIVAYYPTIDLPNPNLNKTMASSA